MKRITAITMAILLLLGLFGCAQKEPSVVKTYEITDPDLVENDEPVTYIPYEELSDGTFRTADRTSNYTYQYRLEITGRLPNAEEDSTYVYLSNIEEITFDQAWKASGLSSNMEDYFDAKDAILVAVK